MSIIYILALCTLIVLVIAIMLNAVGIYGLSKLKANRTFQKLILINLSIGEIIVSVIGFPYFVLVSLGTDLRNPIAMTIFTIATSVRFPLYLLMIFLTVDRLIASKLHISYRRVITRPVVNFTIVFSWTTGAVYCIADLLSGFSITERYSRFLFIAVDSLFLCLVAITYTFILKRIMDQRHLVANSPGMSHIQRRKKKFFKVLSAIILTFTLLVALPDIGIGIVQIACNNVDSLVEQLHKCVTGLYLLALPSIYIFANKGIWTFLTSKFSFTGIFRLRRRNHSLQIELERIPSQVQTRV